MNPFVTFVVSILLLVHVELQACEKNVKPNIVMIVADDMGWNDVGFHGGDVDTPNIDALAYHGVILTRHYAQPVCSPSRTALLTGDYPIRHGMQGGPGHAGNAGESLPVQAKIMPQYFSKLGYKSHLVGKWHLGYQTSDHLPTRRGFDSFFGYLNGYLGYWDYIHYTNGRAGRDIRRNEEGVWGECYGKYLTDLLTDEAVNVINNHQGQDGLLLILTHAAPHSTPLLNQREAPLDAKNTTDRGYFRAMVEKLDKSVGDVTSALDKKGLLSNSIIVFLSDNGSPTYLDKLTNHGSNWPLRGEKTSGHEGGVRTVAAVWSPLFRNLSRVSDQYFHISDWLPTLYAAAGGNPQELDSKDGKDQWSSLKSSSKGTRDTILVNMNDVDNTEAVISNNWKLVKNQDLKPDRINSDHYYGESGRWMKYNVDKVKDSTVSKILGPIPANHVTLRQQSTVEDSCRDGAAAVAEDCHTKYCLFDIFKDPTECHDVAANHTDVVADLASILDRYRDIMVPTDEKYDDKRADPKYWNDYWSPWLDE